MKRSILMLAVLTMSMVVAVPASAQDTIPDEARRAAMMARRDSLEAQVVHRFVGRLSRDLRLTADQRAQTEGILIAAGERRRELVRETNMLRMRIQRASRTATTTDEEFAALLAEFDNLRTREHDLWRRDQDELAGILTARQRVLFLVSWSRFQDDMRDIMQRRMREQGDRRDGDRRDGDRRSDRNR